MGYVASFKNQKWVARNATGEWCSSYKAVMIAMLEAVTDKTKKDNIWTNKEKYRK